MKFKLTESFIESEGKVIQGNKNYIITKDTLYDSKKTLPDTVYRVWTPADNGWAPFAEYFYSLGAAMDYVEASGIELEESLSKQVDSDAELINNLCDEKGCSKEGINKLKDYYQNKLGWSVEKSLKYILGLFKNGTMDIIMSMKGDLEESLPDEGKKPFRIKRL